MTALAAAVAGLTGWRRYAVAAAAGLVAAGALPPLDLFPLLIPAFVLLVWLIDGADTPRHLLVWTTTPWTLPSNVAIAVNRAFRYVELDVEGTRVIVEQTIAQSKVVPGATGGATLSTFPIVGEFSGDELVGKRYEQLLDIVEVDAEHAFRIVAGDFVTQEEGTGVVHMAPAFGADDYETIRREGLAWA